MGAHYSGWRYPEDSGRKEIDQRTRELAKGMEGQERLDVLYGFQTMRPEFAARLLGLDEPPRKPDRRSLLPWWVRLLLFLRIISFKGAP